MASNLLFRSQNIWHALENQAGLTKKFFGWMIERKKSSYLEEKCPEYMNKTPGFQTHVHRVGDAIQPSHPLLSPSPPAPNPSQHQILFQ